MNLRSFLPLMMFCLAVASNASAQEMGSLQQNLQFDQQMFGMIENKMAQNQQQQQQMLQMYIQQNGPRLQQEYQQFITSSGMQIPFATFAYNHMMTQGGANPGPARQLQQDTFRGLQEANKTVQQGNNSYNQGWQQNQQVLGNTYQRYDQGAIRGNQNYVNPQTGERFELPYGAQPGMYGNNNNNFANDPQGNWHQMDPQGYGQQLEQAGPGGGFGGGEYDD